MLCKLRLCHLFVIGGPMTVLSPPGLMTSALEAGPVALVDENERLCGGLSNVGWTDARTARRELAVKSH